VVRPIRQQADGRHAGVGPSPQQRQQLIADWRGALIAHGVCSSEVTAARDKRTSIARGAVPALRRGVDIRGGNHRVPLSFADPV
jgi:hypothetical protein